MYFFLFTLFFLFGYFRISSVHTSAPENDVAIFVNESEEYTKVRVLGSIQDFPDRRYDHDKWILTVEGIYLENKNPDAKAASSHPQNLDNLEEELQDISGKILLKLSKENGIKFGDRLLVSGNLQLPFESDDFSYKKYLAREEIFSLMYFPKYEQQEEKYAHTLLSPLFALRTFFDGELRQRIPSPESAFAAGILIGDRSGFSPEDDEKFRITGLTHLLALSGSNITIIVIAVFGFFFFFPKNIRIFLTLAFITLFVLFVGGGASIVRAAIMGSIGLFVVHSGYRAHGFSLLLLASSVMVLLKPLLLVYDPSFQLSVAGVVGMLLFSKPFEVFFIKLFRLQKRFWAEILAATLAAQLGVLPLISYLFGEISLIAPLSNVFVVPLIPLGMLLSFLAIVFGSFSDIFGNIFGFFSWMLLHFGYVMIDFFAQIPGASIVFSVDEFGFLILSILVGGYGFWINKKYFLKK